MMSSYLDRGLSVEKRGTIALLKFSRPERLNAMTPDMEMAMRDAVEAANADGDIRLIALTGSGKAFCAGADLQAVQEGNYYEKQEALLERAASSPRPYSGRFAYLPLSPKPVIAAINGAAVGVGMTIALHCDLRVGRSGAKLSFAFSRLGLAAEEGVAHLLPRLIGASAAMDLLLSGRTFSADHAKDIGLLAMVADDGDFETRALEYVREMATICSPDAMRRIKAQTWKALLHEYAEAVEFARLQVAETRNGADFREGVASFAEKRSPQYPGLSMIDSGRS